MEKRIIVMIFCIIGIVITTIYLHDKLYGWEKVAWGLWGIFIFIGTMMNENLNEKKNT